MVGDIDKRLDEDIDSCLLKRDTRRLANQVSTHPRRLEPINIGRPLPSFVRVSILAPP